MPVSYQHGFDIYNLKAIYSSIFSVWSLFIQLDSLNNVININIVSIYNQSDHQHHYSVGMSKI